MKRLMIVAMVVGCLGAFAFGQTANAVLTGTAVDSSGALIPGVEVTATNVETGVTTTAVSNETGIACIGSLLPGAIQSAASCLVFASRLYGCPPRQRVTVV